MNSGYSVGLVSNCKSILSLSAPPSLQYTLWTKLLFSFVWKLQRMPHALTAQTFQCNESSGCGFWPRVCQSAVTKQTTSAPSSRHPTLSKPHIIFLEDLQAKLISTRKQFDRRDALRILGKRTDTGSGTTVQCLTEISWHSFGNRSRYRTSGPWTSCYWSLTSWKTLTNSKRRRRCTCNPP